MPILSIQSHVVYGYAGNTAAVFPLQRMGREVWAVNTVEFSNHTGYGAWRGTVLDPGLASELVEGIADRGALPRCEAVLSGYMGDAGIGKAVIEAVRRVKAVAPGALYCCDPVMGDVGRGFYVKPGIPEIFKNEVIPLADMVTPNQFELEAIAGMKVSSMEGAREAIDRIHRTGPSLVLVTSFRDDTAFRSSGSEGGPDQRIDMLVSDGDVLYRISTPELPFKTTMAGSGDLTTAIFLSRYLESRDCRTALELTAAAVYGIMEATFKAGSRELLIIAAQEELVSPTYIFKARRV